MIWLLNLFGWVFSFFLQTLLPAIFIISVFLYSKNGQKIVLFLPLRVFLALLTAILVVSSVSRETHFEALYLNTIILLTAIVIIGYIILPVILLSISIKRKWKERKPDKGELNNYPLHPTTSRQRFLLTIEITVELILIISVILLSAFGISIK